MARKQALSGGTNGRPYSSDIGYLEGKTSQPRFYLSTDKQQAENRRQRLQELWDSCKATHWTAETFAIAQAIRKGETTYPVPRPEGISDASYFQIVQAFAKTYAGITFIPADPEQYATGENQTVAMVASFNERPDVSKIMNVSHRTGRTFFSALDDFAKWIVENMLTKSADPTQRTTTPSGKILSEHVLRLKDCHADLPLEEIDLDAIERMTKYWTDRPASKAYHSKGTKPIAIPTVVNHVKALRRFFKFLTRNRKVYGWTRPDGTEDVLKIDQKGLQFEEEIAALLTGPAAFTLKEIGTLYAKATDLKRLMILCGLNFGFAESEMNSFRWNEIKQENGRNIVSRIRRKTRVPGEFVIWPETMKALEWWKSQTPASDYVFVTNEGERMGGTLFRNNWQGLLSTVNKTTQEVQRLPLKFLRKSAAHFMLEYSEASEVTTGIFQCRGKPVATDFQADKYYRRRFIPVFQAQEQMHPSLAPLFAVADAFTGQARKRGDNGIDAAMIAKIKTYAGSDLTISQISRELGVSRPTIYRHLPQADPTPK